MPQIAAPCAIQASGGRVQSAIAFMDPAGASYSTGVRDGITSASPVSTSSPR